MVKSLFLCCEDSSLLVFLPVPICMGSGGQDIVEDRWNDDDEKNK